MASINDTLGLALNEETFGEYDVATDAEATDVFPKLPDGQTVRITHWKATITVSHIRTGDTISFIITKKGNCYDSRNNYKKSMTRNDLIVELDRLLGQGMGQVVVKKAIREAELEAALPTGTKGAYTKIGGKAKPEPAPPQIGVDVDADLMAGLDDDPSEWI